MRCVQVWLLAMAVLVLGACPTSYTQKEKIPEEPPIARLDDLFTQEEDEGGKVKTTFETNNEQYRKPQGLTIWTVWDGDDIFSSRTVLMRKSDGYSGGGYGMVFCQGEYEIDGTMQPAMLVVMVNNEGSYIIGKAIGGVFYDFGWWKTSPYLNQGAGAGNEVTVSYNDSTGYFILNINGYFIEEFRDDDEPALRGGKNGYIVVITPFDKFPQTVLSVYFTEEK